MFSYEVLNRVSKERLRQEAKWGMQNHSPEKWLRILLEEAGEAAKEAQNIEEMKELSKQFYIEEMVQVAAVAVAAIESFERQNKCSPS